MVLEHMGVEVMFEKKMVQTWKTYGRGISTIVAGLYVE